MNAPVRRGGMERSEIPAAGALCSSTHVPLNDIENQLSLPRTKSRPKSGSSAGSPDHCQTRRRFLLGAVATPRMVEDSFALALIVRPLRGAFLIEAGEKLLGLSLRDAISGDASNVGRRSFDANQTHAQLALDERFEAPAVAAGAVEMAVVAPRDRPVVASPGEVPCVSGRVRSISASIARMTMRDRIRSAGGRHLLSLAAAADRGTPDTIPLDCAAADGVSGIAGRGSGGSSRCRTLTPRASILMTRWGGSRDRTGPSAGCPSRPRRVDAAGRPTLVYFNPNVSALCDFRGRGSV